MTRCACLSRPLPRRRCRCLGAAAVAWHAPPHAELVSCPTCGRCQVNLIEIANEVERRLQTVSAPISVAVKGASSTAPARPAGADIGVACGRGTGLLIAGGETLRKVPEERIVDELFEEIHERFE